jgi:hypothetical protein
VTTDRATLNRQKNEPKCQPIKMAHLVLPDTQANSSAKPKEQLFSQRTAKNDISYPKYQVYPDNYTIKYNF